MKKNWVIILVVILVVVALWLSGVFENKTWTGYYYPDINQITDQSTWVIQPGLESLDACRSWVQTVANPEADYDYQCGFNCTYREAYGEIICESDAR